MLQVMKRLKLVKHVHKEWNISIFGDLNKNISKPLSRLQTVRSHISIDGFFNTLFKEAKAHSHLDNLFCCQDMK